MAKGDGEDAVRALIRFVSSGEYGLKEVPPLIKEVIREGYWRERDEAFVRFEDFVMHPPMAGLGADMPTIKRLCGDDDEALELIKAATAETNGGDRRSEDFRVGNTNSERGAKNDRGYKLLRLRRERPDLHARVLDPDDELTANGAMVEAGFQSRTATVPLEVPDLARAIRRRLTSGQIAELVALLTEVHE
jgi:hypothetical protein